MNNPFERISAAFAPEYRVNLSIANLDGSIMLTLSDDAGVVAKRLISQAQRNDPVRLQRVIDSIRLGLAIELSQNPLQVLAALVQSGKRASELLHLFDPVPQLLKNVRFAGGKPLEDARVQAVIAEAEAQLAGKGRLVIRPSGTEPVIRVMAEGDDQAQVERVVDTICEAVRAAA